MARSILTNLPSKLYLSRRQVALLSEIILAGNKMSETLNPKHPLPKPANRAKLKGRWDYWVVQFGLTLL